MVHYLFFLLGFTCDDDNSQKFAVVTPILLCVSEHFLKEVSALNILRKWSLKVSAFYTYYFFKRKEQKGYWKICWYASNWIGKFIIGPLQV